MEQALKDLKIGPKMLTKRSYSIWDILLLTEEESKQLSGKILMAKALRLQMEYMSTGKDKCDGAWGDRKYHQGPAVGLFYRNMDRSWMYF